MIEHVATQVISEEAYHFAYDKNLHNAVRALDLSPANIDAVVELLSGPGADARTPAAEAILAEAFRPKMKAKQSRFSEGKLPVFYSALQHETAQRETAYHCPEYLQSPANTVFYYRLYSYDFDGSIRDLRREVERLPSLVGEKSDGAYDVCNAIALEAVALNLDGLLTPSARHTGGSCLPAFASGSLSNGVALELYRFAVAESGGVDVSTL